VSGEVFWQNKWQKVTGSAWFDREWGSQMLAADQQGWDWFSLRLDDNTALMVYQIRSIDKDYLYGSIMRRDGSIITLSSEDISLVNMDEDHEEKGSAYPEKFAIEIARENINVEVNVINNNQIMRFGIEYFEGMVQFKGSHSGQGFLEMTGYTH
jgi:predicted secreted hydrolase